MTYKVSAGRRVRNREKKCNIVTDNYNVRLGLQGITNVGRSNNSAWYGNTAIVAVN